MTKTKTPSIVAQIVDRLYSDGALTVSQMCETIKYPYKSVYTKALELQKLNLADKDDNSVWRLREGVTPQTLETGELQEIGEEEPGEEEGDGKKTAPIVRSTTGAPLDQKSMFIQEMKNIGVAPKEAIPTVASIFFSGDIDNLKWLEQVLKRDSAGFVTPHQRRLIISFWSNTRGLPYNPDEFFPELDDEGRPKKAVAKGEKEEEKPAKPFDLGIGWKIGKDKTGEWEAQAGGPMNYKEAVDAAKERQMITVWGRREGEPEAEMEVEGEEVTAGRKGGKKTESLMEYMMKKMVDNMFGEGKAGGDGDSETVRRLTERIDDMEREKNEERMERLEGMVAQAISRDPWDDYDRIEKMKVRLGGGGSAVTDSSPAVQLIKDATDKMDKNVGRLVGLMERTVLKSEAFAPEETRSPQDRERKAGELLSEVRSRERSTTLRKDVFGS